MPGRSVLSCRNPRYKPDRERHSHGHPRTRRQRRRNPRCAPNVGAAFCRYSCGRRARGPAPRRPGRRHGRQHAPGLPVRREPPPSVGRRVAGRRGGDHPLPAHLRADPQSPHLGVAPDGTVAVARPPGLPQSGFDTDRAQDTDGDRTHARPPEEEGQGAADRGPARRRRCAPGSTPPTSWPDRCFGLSASGGRWPAPR